MLAKAELVANLNSLNKVAEDHRDLMAQSLDDVINFRTAVNVAKIVANSYSVEANKAIVDALIEIGIIAVEAQAKRAGVSITSEEARALAAEFVQKQSTERYYGFSLQQRVAISQRRLLRNLHRSSRVGKKLSTKKSNLIGLFTERNPFGAHWHHDKRILISQAQLLHQDIAKYFAEKAEIPVIKWSLSDKHTMKDECDELATAVDKDVEKYIHQLGLDIKAQGMYFIQDIPRPPHPNCQCDFTIVTKKEKDTKTQVHREPNVFTRLLRRLRSIF